MQYGWRGFYAHPWVSLKPDDVKSFHRDGGTPIGTGRGGFDVTLICDAIETRDINIVLCIGGDGTMMGTQKVHEEIVRRGLPIAVVHVPKTIDKDIPIVS